MSFMALFTVLPGIFCGLWANLSMSISLFVNNKFIVVIVPYLFLFFEKVFFDALFSNRINLELSPIVVAILAALFIISLCIVLLRGRNDDVY